MATKRSSADLEREVETELRKLLCDTKCEVCIVPITSDQQREKHYAGKIHAKKVEKWRESWLGRKRARLEERVVIDDRSEQSVRSDIRETSSEDDVHSTAPEREVIREEEPVSVLASSALDPRLLDQLDPSAMKKMLNIKKKNRWDTPEDDNTEEQSDDPSDYSIPQSYNKLMQRCFNSNTGLGYCQICNKLFRSETETSKHFSSSKHSAKVQIYNELLRSEAAVLAGLAQPNPPPHRGYYCEVCEADCSSESQLEQHLCGDRHRTNLRSMERELASDPELDKDINPYNLPELWLRERKHCNLCDVAISSIRMAKIHFNNRNHRLAAGLHITEESRMSEYNSRGDIHCDTCNYNVETQIEMKTHQAGIRHLENERTRQAVEGAGHTWSCHHPAPADQPRYSVQDPGNGWSGDSIGVTPESMMGPHPGMMYPGHMMGGPMPGPYMGGPMGPYPPGPWQPPMMSEKRRYAGVDVDNLNCSLCEVKFTSREQLDHHLENPTHMEKAANVPIEEDESEDYVPVPLTADNISSVRTKTHPIHCPFCKVWFPTITVLKYYHSAREEHQEVVTRYSDERPDGPVFSCAACKISSSSASQLWEDCINHQKEKIFGSNRSHSCDVCDIHLSEAEWLEKHLQGEKHKWIAGRVEQLLPVQWEPQEMCVIQKSDFNQFTWQYHFYPEWQCLVCKVGFTPVDKYRKHLGSLFHLRKCAGEDVEWVEGGGYHF